MTTLHGNLWVHRLTDERRAMTAGPYRYTVTDRGGTAHTAFRTRAALDHWLALLGLSLETILADDAPGSARVVGAYRVTGCLSEADQADFHAAQGVETRWLSNGDYTLAKVTSDADGIRTVWHLNPNVRDRPVFDYRESMAMVG